LLYALTGDIDTPGGNVWFAKPPMDNFLGLDLLSQEQRQKTLGRDLKPLGPGSMGWINARELLDSVATAQPYTTRALVSFGGNPIATTPNPSGVAQGLRSLEFHVHADMFFGPTALYADIFLPVASAWERSGLAAGFGISKRAERYIQLRPPAIARLGESLSDTDIVFALARRLDLQEHFFGGNVEAATSAALTPSGCSLTVLRDNPGGVELPLETQYRKYEQGGFTTPSKKLEFYSERFFFVGYPPLPVFRFDSAPMDDFPLRLISAKSPFFCHSQHRQVTSLRRGNPRPRVAINHDLATRRGITKGDKVAITTHYGRIVAYAAIDDSLAADVVCCQYGWWAIDPSGGDLNFANLIPDRDGDPVSNSRCLRDAFCEIGRLSSD